MSEALTRLRCQRFTHTRWTTEEHNRSLAFALDHIIKSFLVRHLALSKSKDKLLMVGREDEAFESVIIILDVLHKTNRESEPFLIP